LELIVKCHCRRVAEVPIHFADRLHGESKLSLKEQINYLRHLKRLLEFRYRNWAYLLQFLMVGASGMVIDLITYAALLLWLPMGTARGLAIWVAMTWNFFLNRNLTFAYARQGSLVGQYLGFCASCLVGAVVNWSISVALCKWTRLFADHELWAAFLGIVAGTVFNFLLCRYLVFRRAAPPDASTTSEDAGQAIEPKG
jgi:dolichol-phosphate mannosyltransferase